MKGRLSSVFESSFLASYRRYFRIFHGQLGAHMFLMLGLSLISIVLEGFGFLMVLPLFGILSGEAAAFGEAPQQLRDALETLRIPQTPFAILILIVGLFTLKGVVSFAESIYSLKISRRQQLRVRQDLLRLYGHLDYRQILARNAGSMLQIVRSEAEVFFRSTWAFIRFNVKAVAALGYVAFAFAVNWYFSVIAVASGAVLVAIFSILSVFIRNSSRRVSAENRALEKMMLQTFQSLKYLTATARFPVLESRAVGNLRSLAREQFRLGTIMAANQAVKEPLLVIVVTGLVTLQTLVLDQPLGPMIVALALFYRALSTILSLHGSWQQIIALTGGFETTMTEVAALREHQETRGEQQPPRGSSEIVLDHVTFAYGDQVILDDVSLTIPPNSTVAFVGESGAGKSTLLSLLTLQLRPDRGTIFVDGIRHTEIDQAAWRGRIGFVTQDTVIFDETIANNISLWATTDSPSEENQLRMVESARRAHCDGFISELESGYETIAGDRGVRLSGGQKQRIFIARELFREPDILLMDEATSALDTKSESSVQASINEMKGTMTVVLVAHRLSTIRHADVIHVLEKGRIAESGTYEELMNRTGSRFAAMARMGGTTGGE